MIRKIAPLLLVTLLISARAGLADPIQAGDRLTLEKCLDIARKTNPQMMTAAAGINASRSRIGQARATYFPQLNLSSGYNNNWSAAGSAQNSSSDYSTNIGISQNIWDFGKTSTQVDIGKLNLNSAFFNLDDVSSQIVLQVKLAYYQVLQTRQAEEVAQDAVAKIPVAELTVTQARENLELANGRYEAGVGSPIEVTDSQVAYSQAQYTYIQALYQYQTARASLDKAMGVK